MARSTYLRESKRVDTLTPSCPQSVPLRLLALFHDDAENDHIHHVIEDFDIQHYSRFSKRSDFYVFCNPAIKEFRVLPEQLFLDTCFCMYGGGLGYDSVRNDYKFVRFGYEFRLKKSRAEIYSLNNDSWRGMKVIGFEINEDWNIHAELFCRGVLYWVVYDKRTGSYVQLLSFNVSDELFFSLPLPDNSQLLKKECNLVRIKPGEWNESTFLFLDQTETANICTHFNFECSESISIDVLEER
ncbi:F-box associated interaction domain containing protein [Trema orientale]|uniref:F-box associated interaction domain containing protein n=1 Tax=Trema orientale TaxID=63057 RepID=A0A2P5E926_TREOI|nr:F-box associated interaction domain containing protein [Trema orientale]